MLIMFESGSSAMRLVYDEFESLSDTAELPFPLNLDFWLRLLIAVILMVVFFKALGYRAVIFQYLAAEDSKKPINLLIFMDQLNGSLLGVGLVVRLVTLLYPYPLARVLGSDFCYWVSLPGGIYSSGKTCWSCVIALLRVIHIKAQVSHFTI